MPNDPHARTAVTITVPKEAKPSFANAAQVTVSDDAVIIQFAFVRPNSTTDGQLVSEVVLSPKHAIDFSRALDTTLKKHFTRHLENET